LFRIVLTPFFIICLFYEHPYSNLWALSIFIVASITDAYDGYFARKYNLVTAQGRFLEPLADKILVSSAFISFAVLGVVEYWMVSLIIFRDLFVTGLRMVMEKNGFTMLTSNIAKAKTAIQITIIIFILLFIGLKGIPFEWLRFEWLAILFGIIKEFHVIYYLTLVVTVFTIWTGISYLYNNRSAIRQFTS
jgi:CDP-diacylglycerol--glycerol-3-phosphate 3-phosphatidyltransferase